MSYEGTLPESYALHTIGGSAIKPFRYLKSGFSSGGRRVRVNSITASEEEIIGIDGIHKTTEVSVVSDSETRHQCP